MRANCTFNIDKLIRYLEEEKARGATKVSLHQPWVRPIVRGKTAVAVEFGAKVALSMNEGYARVEEISW
ncbi:MAG: IS5/IS1182 family transposase, partial [Desulfobulbus sp.]|nr:IS5/IS1182 family transposase [Desulfobulbus sp.]